MGNFRGWKQSVEQKKIDRVKEFLYDIQREKECDKIRELVENLYIDMIETNGISMKKFEAYLKKYGFTIDKP